MSTLAHTHDWQWVKDWYGDPLIPNGTADCSHWKCATCGEEADEIEAHELPADRWDNGADWRRDKDD